MLNSFNKLNFTLYNSYKYWLIGQAWMKGGWVIGGRVVRLIFLATEVPKFF